MLPNWETAMTESVKLRFRPLGQLVTWISLLFTYIEITAGRSERLSSTHLPDFEECSPPK